MVGRDATHIFEAYHKLSTEKLLGSSKVPLVGSLANAELPLYTGSTTFYRELRQKAEDFFEDKGVKDVRQINLYVLCNTAFILSVIVACYYLSMYSSLPYWQCMFFAALGGLFHYLSMVHVWHDLSHCAWTRYPAVWRWFGYSGAFLLGQSMETWLYRHVIGHHIYTNVSGIAPDIGIYKAYPKTPMRKYRSDRPILLPTFLQPIVYIFSVAHMQVDDYFSFQRCAQENIRMNLIPLVDDVFFWMPKVGFLIHRVILPVYFGYHSIWGALYLFLLTEGVAGLFFGLFSQVSHVSEEVAWPEGSPISEGWAEMQVQTAHDYGHNSYFWTYLAGYLNYQVVHHLFPGVAPHFYPYLVPIVKDHCRKYGIRYSIFPDFWQPLAMHWNHIKQFQVYFRKNSKKTK